MNRHSCEHCGVKFKFPDSKSGELVNCPKCKEQVQLPIVHDGENLRKTSAEKPTIAPTFNEMKSTSIHCNSCLTRFKYSDANAGKVMKCPKCSELLKIPGQPSKKPLETAPESNHITTGQKGKFDVFVWSPSFVGAAFTALYYLANITENPLEAHTSLPILSFLLVIVPMGISKYVLESDSQTDPCLRVWGIVMAAIIPISGWMFGAIAYINGNMKVGNELAITGSLSFLFYLFCVLLNL